MNFQPLLDRFQIQLKAEELHKRWTEPHRKYHTQSHLDDLLRQIEAKSDLQDHEKNLLFVAALFHDIIYDPKRHDNEERSAQLLEQNSSNTPEIQHIAQIIHDTKDHSPSDPLSRLFSEMDMAIVTRPLPDLLEWEKGIRFEYSHYSNLAYKFGRLRFIQAMRKRYPANSTNLRTLQWRILFPKFKQTHAASCAATI